MYRESCVLTDSRVHNRQGASVPGIWLLTATQRRGMLRGGAEVVTPGCSTPEMHARFCATAGCVRWERLLSSADFALTDGSGHPGVCIAASESATPALSHRIRVAAAKSEAGPLCPVSGVS